MFATENKEICWSLKSCESHQDKKLNQNQLILDCKLESLLLIIVSQPMTNFCFYHIGLVGFL